MIKSQKRNKKEDQDYAPGGPDDKRNYKFVSSRKKEKLIQLAVDQKIKVNKASRKVRVNNSNAKVIVKKEKAKRQQAKIENTESVKDQEVKVQQVQQIEDNIKKETEEPAQQKQEIPILMQYYTESITYLIPVLFYQTNG